MSQRISVYWNNDSWQFLLGFVCFAVFDLFENTVNHGIDHFCVWFFMRIEIFMGFFEGMFNVH